MKNVSLLKMYFKLVVLNCLLALVSADLLSTNNVSITRSQDSFGDRLVGGHDAEVGQFPYIVSVQCISPGDNLYFCGGSIINSQWILTAAHCIKAYYENCPDDSLYIRAGKHNIFIMPEPNEQLVKVQKYIVHENYHMSEQLPRDDILLLKLERPLVINKYVRPIKLPGPFSEPRGNATIAGWGFNNPEETTRPKVLQTVDVIIIDRKLCLDAIKILNPELIQYLYNTNICTGPLYGGVAHCGGDSGGPLVVNVDGQEELVGVVSWGFKECGIIYGPSVYAKVSDYVYWIIDKIVKN